MREMFMVVSMLMLSFVVSPVWSTMRIDDIQIVNVVEEGAACSEKGRLALDANGAPLVCQSGRWTNTASHRAQDYPQFV